jgi:hypothetical protein
MIVYQMACGRGHHFEGWYASAQACERQAAAGHLLCPSCSTSEVRKLPSAPYVKSASTARRADAADPGKLRGRAIEVLRNYVLANSDDVGRRFAEMARRMHYKEEEARNIRGQVTAEEAGELQDEGIEAFEIPSEILPPPGEVH